MTRKMNPRTHKKKTAGQYIADIIKGIVLFIACLVTAFPFFWMIFVTL